MSLSELIGLFVGVLVASRVLQSGRRLLTNPIVSDTAFSLVFDINNHFMGLSHDHFAKTPIGSMSEYFTTGSVGAQDLTTQLFNQILPTTIESLTAIGIASWRFGRNPGLAFSAIFITYVGYSVLVSGFIARAQKEVVRTRGEMTRGITSTLMNYETIQLFNALPYEMDRIKQKLQAVKNANTNSLSLPDKIAMGQWLIIGAGLSGLLLLTEDISVGSFVGLSFYSLLFTNLFANFGDGLSKATAACRNLAEVANVFRLKPKVVDRFPDRYIKDFGENVPIVFDNVSFSYDGTKPILQDLSFTLEPGRVTAIVGESGAGKSTIAKLLCRFYDFQEGAITIGGLDIREVSLRTLRDAIGVIPQAVTAFNDSIEFNIWYGALSKYGNDVEADRVAHALQLASLEKFVEQIPGKLKAKVGERGAKISGGQLQRVGIARAVAKDSPVMLFDEATSALDTRTEQEVQRTLYAAAAGRTTVIISHKLANVKEADKIIVLKQGQKVEEGTHQSLLEQRGIYSEMWERQSREYEETARSLHETHRTSQIPARFFRTPQDLIVPVNDEVLSINSLTAPDDEAAKRQQAKRRFSLCSWLSKKRQIKPSRSVNEKTALLKQVGNKVI
jgi:ATP-binding cassette, subfamily B, heavy metal transporter